MIACIQKFYPPNLKKTKNKTYVNHVLVEFTLTGLTCTYIKITPWGTYDMYSMLHQLWSCIYMVTKEEDNPCPAIQIHLVDDHVDPARKSGCCGQDIRSLLCLPYMERCIIVTL